MGSILHYLAPGSLSRVGGEAPPGPALQEENIRGAPLIVRLLFGFPSDSHSLIIKLNQNIQK